MVPFLRFYSLTWVIMYKSALGLNVIWRLCSGYKNYSHLHVYLLYRCRGAVFQNVAYSGEWDA